MGGLGQHQLHQPTKSATEGVVKHLDAFLSLTYLKLEADSKSQIF